LKHGYGSGLRRHNGKVQKMTSLQCRTVPRQGVD
jgi:hypothetical protein